MGEEPENWWEHGGPYDGTDCIHCGRQRVEFATAPDGTERRVCEKCGWDQGLGDYATMYQQQPALPAPQFVDPEKAAKRAQMNARVDEAIAAGHSPWDKNG